MSKSDTKYDLEFYWDLICPFAWMTSRWIHQVKDEYKKTDRQLNVDWKFICLREINRDKDYEKFPPGYVEAHTGGQKMLRVAAAARKAHGREVMEPLYTAFGEAIWDVEPPEGVDGSLNQLAERMKTYGSKDRIETALEKAGLPLELAEAANDDQYDAELAAESEEALSRTGKDVGTPIITFNPPDGLSLFGPVISALPKTGEEAVKYFEAVQLLTEWQGFAELKRSLRDRLQLKVLGF